MRTVSSTWRWVETSRPVVGSSSTMSEGRQANAMARPMRCCWPPESWCGYRRSSSGACVEPYLAHDLGDARLRVVDDARVHPQGLAQLGAHPQRRVERRRRILRHVADPGAARCPQLARAEREQVEPVQADLARR